MSDPFQNSQPKSLWSRPDGKVAITVPIVLLAVLGVFTFLNLPLITAWLVGVLTNMVHAALLAGVLVVLFLAVTDGRLRALCWYGWRALVRFLVGSVINIDPIGILQSYSERLRERLAEMRAAIDQLDGQRRCLQQNIESNERLRQESLRRAGQAAKDQNLRKAFILQSRQAGRLQKSNMSLQDLANRMTALSEKVKKVYEAAEFLAADIESEVEVKSRERKQLLAGYNAFKAARRIIEGGDDEREIYNQALEKITEDYGMKMGEIESFMDMSQGIIQSVDLENGIYELEALEQLAQIEKKSEAILASTAVQAPVRVADDLPSFQEVAGPTDLYDELFEKPERARR